MGYCIKKECPQYDEKYIENCILSTDDCIDYISGHRKRINDLEELLKLAERVVNDMRQKKVVDIDEWAEKLAVELAKFED